MIKKMMKRIIIAGLILIGVVAIASIVNAGGTHFLVGYVKGNVTATYKVYVSASPTKTGTGSLTYNSGSGLSYFAVNIDNFYPDWKDKQTAVAVYQKGSNGSTAQYGVAALTLDANDADSTQEFAQVTALKTVPKPIATAGAAGTGKVTLTWTAATSASTSPTGIAGYNVYRTEDQKTYTKVKLATTNSFTDTTGTAGKKYYYAIKISFTGGVESLRSADSAQATFPTKSGTTPAASTLTIDDFEGKNTYDSFGAGVSAPTLKTGSYNSTKMGETTYSYASGYGGGWGGNLPATIDISKNSDGSVTFNTISYHVKPDGSANEYHIVMKVAASGKEYRSTSQTMTGTSWKTVKVAYSAMWYDKDGDGTKDTDETETFDLATDKKIKRYNIVYTGKTKSTTAHAFDNIEAIKATVSTDPTITSLDKSKAKAGDTVTISGANLGTAGKIEFAGTGVKSYIESTASSISSWSSGSIVFKVPSSISGKMDLSIIRSSDSKQSNSVSFEVTALSTGGTSYNYPNPFNPTGGGSTKIVFDAGTATSATIYIFNTSAEIVEKLSWTGGTAEVSWNGKDAYGEILGDGVYLYRVADGSKLLGRGKILIINN